MVMSSRVIPQVTLSHSPNSPPDLLRFKIGSTSTHKRIWVSRRNNEFLHREETFINGPVVESENPDSIIFKPLICYMLSWSQMDMETKTVIANQIHRKVLEYLRETGLKEGLVTIDLWIMTAYFVDKEDSVDPNIKAMIEEQEREGNNTSSGNWWLIGAVENVRNVNGDRFCDWSCNVCLEGFNGLGLISRLPCLHEFHEHCIISWLKTSPSCPICRKQP